MDHATKLYLRNEGGTFRKVLLALFASLLTLTAFIMPGAFAQAAPTTTNEPLVAPHVINVFPQRDFVSASGYAADELVTVEVIHPDGTTFSAGSGLAPQDDPRTTGFDGLVEVNHPGGYCWQGTTPDIRPGDRVKVTVDATGVADQTTVANVTNGRPVQTAPDTVVVHGTAADAAGNPLPIDQIEQRLIANRQAFDLNGTRSLRASSVPTRRAGGALAYDAPGSTHWTATYSGLDAHDVTMALGAESIGLWLGANPAAAVESTSYEVGAGIVPGPAAPCTAPLEKIPPAPGSDQEPPSAPSGLTASVTNSNRVTLDWSAAADNVGVVAYGIYRDGVAIANVQNPDGSAPAPTTFVDKNVAPGTYTYTVDAQDANSNRGPLSNEASATTTAQAAASVPLNDPPALPVSIIPFPSRDFISAEGFEPTDTVDVELIRDGKVISTSFGNIPQDDPKTDGWDGLVEVNHPGGSCWEGVTPEIRPGDVVRTTAYNPDGTLRTIDQTTTSNVTAQKPVVVKQPSSPSATDGIVEVHGTAMGTDGNPLPLDQIEQRLVANRDAFDLNGRRTLRAAGDGTISYDKDNNPTGVKWTATYTGLSADDVARSVGGTSISTGTEFAGAESRILWLGRDPLAGNESTIFEAQPADPPGPSPAFCTTPLETPDTQAPTAPAPSASQIGADIKLDWSASNDDWYVYGYRIYRDGQPLKNLGASVTSFTNKNVLPGDHTYAVAAFDTASPLGADGPGVTIIDRLQAGQGQPYGNESAKSSQPITVTDVSAPSVPTGLSAKATPANTVELSWNASADDVGVISYGVYRRPSADPLAAWTRVGEATSTSYTDDTVTTGGSYDYAIDAADAASNRSAKSDPVSVNVVIDNEAPSVPEGVVALNSPDIHGKDVKVSWKAATDNVGVSGYGIYRDGSRIAQVNSSTLSYTDTNRPAGTYAYSVEALDSAANRSGQSGASRVVVANDPPVGAHSIIAFPQRDFVSATGYSLADGPYTVSVIRNGSTVSESQPIVPEDDPKTAGFDGLVEVNHAGNGCWTLNTPDIRPGDVVRVTSASGVADQTTTANVTTQRPIQTAPETVVVHGAAADAAGNPIALDQIEQRLVANRDAFDLNGRRILRAAAASDGTLRYDAPGSTHWTATYSGLSAADVSRALNAESTAQWLGRDPLANNEGTIYENGADIAGGPATLDCTAPIEPSAPLANASPNTLAFADQSAIPASTSAAKTVTLSNAGTTELKVSDVYIAGANAGDFAISPNTLPATLAPGASLSVDVSFSPTAVGARSATLNLQTSAANQGDFSISLGGNGIDAAAPAAPGRPTQAITGSQLGASTVPVMLNWSASSGGAPVTHYQLQQSTNGGAFTDVTLRPGAVTGTTLNLAPGNYSYQVRACADTHCSAWMQGPAFNLGLTRENSKDVSYGGVWTTQALTGASGGSVRFASTAKEKAIFRFSGTQVEWIGARGPNRGRAEVWLDGARVATVDLYNPTVDTRQVLFAREGLSANTTHQLEVRVLGTKNASSSGTRVDIDAFVAIR